MSKNRILCQWRVKSKPGGECSDTTRSTESLDKTQAHRFCPSWVRVAANQKDSTLGKKQTVKCWKTRTTSLKSFGMFSLTCRILCHIVFRRTSCFSFFLFVARPPPRQPRMKWSKYWTCGEIIEQTLTVRAG